jgi:hypothetical protein
VSVANRFHLFVASTTIAVAFWVSKNVTITTDSHAEWAGAAKMLGAYIGSAAFYQLLATALRWLFDHLRPFRKAVFGNEYLEGTWIGAYGAAPNKRFTIENFEQTIDGIVIRGYAFTESDVLHARWTSRAVAFDATSGNLTYSYDCDLLASKISHQGIAFFSANRKGVRAAAHGLNGYSADLVDGTRSINFESKLSDKQVDPLKALAAAKAL